MKGLFRAKFLTFPTVKAAYALRRTDRVKLLVLTVTQIFLGVLDLIGVVGIGALGALSGQGAGSQKVGNKVGTLLRILNLQNLDFQSQVAFIGFAAAFVLIFKTVVSIFITRKTFFFLSHKSAEISSELVSKFLSQSLIQIQTRSKQQTLYIVSEGVKNLMVGMLATLVGIAADIVMLVIMFIGLIIIDPVIAILTTSLFICVGFLLYRLLQVRARRIGSEANIFTVESNQKILEVLDSYRESVVRNRRQFYGIEIRVLLHALATTNAELDFMPFISKYVIESTAVLGSLALAGYEFATKNAIHAVATLAVFMAASFRIAPAALRIQQGLIKMKSSSGSAASALEMLEELDHISSLTEKQTLPEFEYDTFSPKVVLKEVSFTYSANNLFNITDINLTIEPGTSVALVGPSGAGKTTLVDLILGILESNSGLIEISGIKPVHASLKWPGAISYVPQDIVISSGTIRQNVGLGYEAELMTDARVWRALEIAQLSNVVTALPLKLDEFVGESGGKISGGQRQRLGIARALFTSPRLLVLDEATSSLDGQTEADITSAISALSGNVTVIVVAHRLSTVRAVDKVVYMDNGRILSSGTFDQVRVQIPEFDKQASLMGL